MSMPIRLPKFLRAMLPLAILAAAACGGPGSDGATTIGIENPQQNGGSGSAPVPELPGSSPEAPAPAPQAPEVPAPAAPAPAPVDEPKSHDDVFGVKMIYPTKSGGETWFMKEAADLDPRFDPQKPIKRNGDGSWKMQDVQVRMQVHTSASSRNAEPVVPTYNRNQLAQKGYMFTRRDWKNIEMTGFVKLNRTSDTTDGFTWYARGGRHNDESDGCEGSAYKGDLHFNGSSRLAKESWHVQYDYVPHKQATGSILGRWVGFKTVLRNVAQNGTKAVRIELFLNDTADGQTWKKIYEFTDAGWGSGASHCGGSPDDMPISWGGPLATFRWDNADDVDFKWLSVREIDGE
jgi:hypothetical protein